MRILRKLSALLVLAAVSAPGLARAEPRLQDPVPRDAVRTILPITQQIVPIRSTIVPIQSQIVDTTVTQESASADEIRLSLAADVLFDFDHAELKPDAAPAIAKVVDAMNRIHGGHVTVLVEGHTDSVGDAEYNRALSMRRAESVRSELARRAGPGASFSVDGCGSTRPVAPNKKPDGSDDPLGRARNRRVEIVVKGA